jgi:hypothetical protein
MLTEDERAQIRATVATWPPLTTEQREVLAPLLASGRKRGGKRGAAK